MNKKRKAWLSSSVFDKEYEEYIHKEYLMSASERISMEEQRKWIRKYHYNKISDIKTTLEEFLKNNPEFSLDIIYLSDFSANYYIALEYDPKYEYCLYELPAKSFSQQVVEEALGIYDPPMFTLLKNRPHNSSEREKYRIDLDKEVEKRKEEADFYK